MQSTKKMSQARRNKITRRLLICLSALFFVVTGLLLSKFFTFSTQSIEVTEGFLFLTLVFTIFLLLGWSSYEEAPLYTENKLPSVNNISSQPQRISNGAVTTASSFN